MVQSAPRLIVGLGNPGAEYTETRHNAGFWFCERLAETLGVSLRPEARFHGLIGRSGDTWLLLPQTFMNRSGQSVLALAHFYRILPNEILVVHDELDIPPGHLRLKFGGGLGGHNGLKDITARLSSQDFWRLRVGIGHPGDKNQVANFVLNRARREEQELIDAALERALGAWPKLAGGEWEAATRVLNAKPPV
ncbi:MAG: aminoacyl-tRNA hydrolase [Candidatus Dactylopiibacterium carminicum]|uniref:Peptidyl-tRNA hydrolase n=1 Tax=Candidatus Dactylopiibacterium carminicum TaxID=857335 RepID=A0A272EQ25_9RHOO|nr:aminoacyl-tRNA hydrolase [Candidatus Dactylopiibacterium carminicum]KAF7598456.1 aminoacyl-tRNA hydrolase [Candidatus Dactylopiibacterium carminicum]PAS92214.1 MAG: aminoacyl-tRNA hydrolase [Candidatus Dactylopiibacterium carminicum]PAS95729.1 MAG: aminoacyl-tRNA hydrolase [Candidatus Dactylopiibacterium carminicum]PAS97776.1 MAG: aminoacyl-tRNA hydrolase [Candidatus Dactylopiibacterium carminicum]